MSGKPPTNGLPQLRDDIDSALQLIQLLLQHGGFDIDEEEQLGAIAQALTEVATGIDTQQLLSHNAAIAALTKKLGQSAADLDAIHQKAVDLKNTLDIAQKLLDAFGALDKAIQSASSPGKKPAPAAGAKPAAAAASTNPATSSQPSKPATPASPAGATVDAGNLSLSVGQAGEYAPNPQAARILGSIVSQLPGAKPIKQQFIKNPRFLAMLASGELYFDSSMELDTDGWPGGGVKGDPDWQRDTSLRYQDAVRTSLNANKVPYFVLPLPGDWPSQFKISLGDYAAVICRDRLAFAVFADQGPRNKLGEGSIALLRALGSERIKPDGTVINAGLDGNAITIVFPGSGAVEDRSDEATLLAAIDAKGRKCFQSLGGILPIGKPSFEALTAHLGSGIDAIKKIKETLGYSQPIIADNKSSDISPYIKSAYSLLLDSNKKAIQVPPDVVTAITDAHEIGGPQLPKEVENRFWQAYGLLNNSIRPAQRASTLYRTIFYVVLFVLLFGQFFFLSGDYVHSKLVENDAKLVEIKAKATEPIPLATADQIKQIEHEQTAYIALSKNLLRPFGYLGFLSTTPPADDVGDLVVKSQLNMLLVFLSGYLLPMLYGLLGACAYVLRKLSDEILKLTYSRDARIRYSLRLNVGLLAGLAVGWFIKPGVGDANLISLSPLALAFIAGYGSDLFFAALDKIVQAFTPATEKAPDSTT